MKRHKNRKQVKHKGFVVAIEVMFTLAMITSFISFTAFTVKVMNVQRYMNTVMTSVASEASRWGGTDTNAYHVNVSNVPILTQAQNELSKNAPDFNPVISGTPNKISYAGQDVTIRLDYSLPGILGPSGFRSFSKVNTPYQKTDLYETVRDMHMSVSVASLLEPGKLL